jgi:hypothetical protein
MLRGEYGVSEKGRDGSGAIIKQSPANQSSARTVRIDPFSMRAIAAYPLAIIDLDEAAQTP